jgi:hypothetical protein
MKQKVPLADLSIGVPSVMSGVSSLGARLRGPTVGVSQRRRRTPITLSFPTAGGTTEHETVPLAQGGTSGGFEVGSPPPNPLLV